MSGSVGGSGNGIVRVVVQMYIQSPGMQGPPSNLGFPFL